MTTPITKEQLTEKLKHRISVAEKYPDVDEAQLDATIFKIALAAMDAEPVYQWRERYEEGSLWEDCTKEQYDGFAKNPECEARVLYTAPPAPVVIDERASFNAWNNEDNLPIAGVGAKNAAWLAWQARAAMLQSFGNTEQLEPVSQPYKLREQVRREHAEWSDKTFGDVGPIGPLKHLSKEALEAAADPSDSLEWADMQFLLWDAQRRMGISDEFITKAMIEKLEINKSRQWPEPKDGEPRMHIKEAGNSTIVTTERVCTCPSGDDSLRWPCPVHPGNSPVIPGDWQLVPKLVTPEISNAINVVGNRCTCGNCSQRLWDLLLAAAPRQEGK